MLEGTKENLHSLGKPEDYFNDKRFTADCNYYDTKNLQICEAE